MSRQNIFHSSLSLFPDHQKLGRTQVNCRPTTHTGTVTATCTVYASGGTFANPGLANSMTSSAGTVSTICNSSGSKLDLTLVAPVAADSPAGTATSGLTRTFSVGNGAGAYAAITAPTPYAATYPTINDLSSGYSSTASTLDVTTKAAADAGKNLPAGSYTIKVLATVTP